MSDLFGAPSGVIAFHQDQDQQVATQQRFSQMGRAEVLNAVDQQNMAMNAAKMQRQTQMLGLLAQGPQTAADGTTPGAQLEELGGRLLKGGFVTEGSNLLNKSSEILSREAAARNSAVHAKVALAGQTAKQMDSLHNFLAASNDPASFDAAKMIWLNENPGVAIPPALQAYDPTVIEGLRKVTKTGQEMTKRAQSDTRIEALKDYRNATAAERARHDRQVEANQAAMRAISERRIAAQTKAAGKPTVVTAANTADIMAAKAMIQEDFPDLPADMPLGKELVPNAAYDLASESKALMAKNRGLSMPEAMTQVYAKMKETGSFQTVERPQGVVKKLLGMAPDKGTKYSRNGAPAIPFVAGKTQPETGKIYDPGDGSKWKFDGKKMVNVE